MKKLLLLIPFVIVGLLAGLYGAYRYYQTMPGQSLKTIRTSISEHDWETFRSYVEVDAILQAAADDLLMEKMNQDKSVYSMQQLTETYEQQVRPEFLQVTQKRVQEYIEKGRMSFPQGQGLSPTERWLKQGEFNAMTISGISKPIVQHGEADIVINFTNPDLKASFEIGARLVQQADGTWKLMELSKLPEFSRAMEKALAAKLDRLNTPIRQEMESVFQVQDLRAEITQGDEYGFSELLRVWIRADIKSEKPMAQITGRVRIEAPEAEDTFAPFVLDMAYKPKGVQTITVDKVLNPFVRSDVKIMHKGLKKSALHVEVTGVTYLDGTSLQLLTELPE